MFSFSLHSRPTASPSASAPASLPVSIQVTSASFTSPFSSLLSIFLHGYSSRCRSYPSLLPVQTFHLPNLSLTLFFLFPPGPSSLSRLYHLPYPVWTIFLSFTKARSFPLPFLIKTFSFTPSRPFLLSSGQIPNTFHLHRVPLSPP